MRCLRDICVSCKSCTMIAGSAVGGGGRGGGYTHHRSGRGERRDEIVSSNNKQQCNERFQRFVSSVACFIRSRGRGLQSLLLCARRLS